MIKARREKMKRVVTTIVAVVLMVGATALAQEQEREWDWSLTPYAWLAGMKGDVGVKGISSPVDESPSDVLDALELSGSLTLDGNNGKWGVLSDVFYVSLESTEHTAIGRFKGEIEEWIISAVPYYRVVSNEKMTLDLGAGARYINLDVEVTTPANKKSGTEEWMDPLVMARVIVPVVGKCYLGLSGDIGGGVESDLTWRLTAVGGYSLTENVDLLVGYRHLDVDYSSDGTLFDTETSGAILGVKIAL
jgi:hypothetical protein